MVMAASEFCAVCICGGIGAVCRFALDGAVRRLWKHSFPLSTFIINALASFGFLGGFSTFSTAVNEIVSLARCKKYGTCIGYFFSIATVPVLYVALGYFIVK